MNEEAASTVLSLAVKVGSGDFKICLCYVKYQERFLNAYREARGNKGRLWK